MVPKEKKKVAAGNPLGTSIVDDLTMYSTVLYSHSGFLFLLILKQELYLK